MAIAGLASGACAADAPVAHRFEIDGRQNLTPFLAADDSTVALTWTVTGDAGADVYLAVSEDAGTTFSPPARINGDDRRVRTSGEMGPRLAISAEVVTAAWVSQDDSTLVLRTASSADRGRTFGAPALLHQTGLQGARGWADLAVSGDGRVHAVWLDGRHAAPPPSTGGAHVHGAAGGAPRQDLFHRAWMAGAQATAPPEASVAADVCFCCKTAVAVGPTGRLFAAWRHIFPGGIRDIALAASDDGGATFSEPVRVSADNWELDACPDDGPALAVDDDGGVHVAWPTLVDTADGPAKGIFYTYSIDGLTFTPRLRLDGAPTPGGAHPRLAVADGRAVVVWDELGPGGRRVMMRGLTTGPEPVPAAAIEVASSGYYPAVAISEGGALVAWIEPDEAGSAIRVARVH